MTIFGRRWKAPFAVSPTGLTGLAWPEKAERNARLRECAEVIRALLAGG